ncbi:MAG: hypothetical protein WAU28_02730 [Candidatus Moraniibacteriota bacterium]
MKTCTGRFTKILKDYQDTNQEVTVYVGGTVFKGTVVSVLDGIAVLKRFNGQEVVRWEIAIEHITVVGVPW